MSGSSEQDALTVRIETAAERFIGDLNASKSFVWTKLEAASHR